MHHAIRACALFMAILGGAVLSALIVMTCVSVLGREIGAVWPGSGLGPITGDFELVEAGMAFVLFAFLPLAQIDRAHATVDVFAARFPARAQRGLAAVTEVVFAAVLIVIAVQLWAGMISKRDSGQTTFLLQFPLWWAYAVSVSGAALAALTAVYLAAVRVMEAWTGAHRLPPPPGSAS
jgi:TRAP-type C4-dicarboxylate transport system permease small subunit